LRRKGCGPNGTILGQYRSIGPAYARGNCNLGALSIWSEAMAAVRRSCMWLGTVATVSLVLSLAVMLFLVETPQVATWFLASAALAAAAYLTALAVAYFEP